MTTTAMSLSYEQHIQAVAEALREQAEAQAAFDAVDQRLADAGRKMSATRSALQDYNRKRVDELLDR